MNPFRQSSIAAAAIIGLTLGVSAHAADPAPPIAAGELAARLSALRQNGSTYVRLRLEVKGATNETLQLQIKERRTKTASDVVYQVIWPKERKGESVLLRKAGNRPASGSVFVPPSAARPIDDLKALLLGSDLAYEDVIEDFFAWDQQAMVGTEDVDRVNCQILESKPGKGERSMYSSVRSWIDTRRMVPLRVEKYSGSGQLVRRIDTTRVVADVGNHIPANLTIRGPKGTTTELDGSRIKHDVAYTDRDFTVEGMQDVTTPRSSSE